MTFYSFIIISYISHYQPEIQMHANTQLRFPLEKKQQSRRNPSKQSPLKFTNATRSRRTIPLLHRSTASNQKQSIAQYHCTIHVTSCLKLSTIHCKDHVTVKPQQRPRHADQAKLPLPCNCITLPSKQEFRYHATAATAPRGGRR